MPLYEYECFVCSHRFERIQKATAEPETTCPECGGSVRRLLGAPALQFKGSGWYVTDYGKGNGSQAGSDAAKAPPADKAASSGESPKAATSGSDAASSKAASGTG